MTTWAVAFGKVSPAWNVVAFVALSRINDSTDK